MKTIFKYPLTPGIDLPVGAKVLTVQVQYGKPVLWAEIDPDVKETKYRRFLSYGTGHAMPANPGTYIATFQLHGGELVFHVYEDA